MQTDHQKCVRSQIIQNLTVSRTKTVGALRFSTTFSVPSQSPCGILRGHPQSTEPKKTGEKGTEIRGNMELRMSSQNLSTAQAEPSKPSEPHDLLTVEQAANYLQLSTFSIRSFIRQGRLKAFRVAGLRKVLIPRAELLTLLEPTNFGDGKTPTPKLG